MSTRPKSNVPSRKQGVLLISDFGPRPVDSQWGPSSKRSGEKSSPFGAFLILDLKSKKAYQWAEAERGHPYCVTKRSA